MTIFIEHRDRAGTKSLKTAHYIQPMPPGRRLTKANHLFDSSRLPLTRRPKVFDLIEITSKQK
jgi:hypothetical protein